MLRITHGRWACDSKPILFLFFVITNPTCLLCISTGTITLSETLNTAYFGTVLELNHSIFCDAPN